MFTGLVEDVGQVVSCEHRGGSVRLVVQTGLDVVALEDGASVAVDGACFTVVERGNGTFGVDVGPESLERTVAGAYRHGARVNLERALAAGQRLGGHFVLGHVDAVGTLVSVTARGDAFDLRVAAPESVLELTPPKGSICMAGVSLTVNQVAADSFEVSIIPHTWHRTNLAALAVGSKVNLETDMLARTVAWLLMRRGVAPPASAAGGVTEQLLRKAGFL